MKVAVLLTVYNRKEITIKSLQSLYSAINKLPNDISFDVILVNDGCTDGTPEAVHKLFPQILIVKSSGNLFWSKGMRLAWQTALEKDDYDYFIWFNDDAILYTTALQELFDTAKVNNYSSSIIVSGAFEDSQHKVSYGGKNSQHESLIPNGKPQPIHYMNGNLVLISKDVVKKIGIIDSIFHHGGGDYDYGLRAIKNNIFPILTTKYVGQTERHDTDFNLYRSSQYSLKKRFKILYSPKYSIINEYKYLNRHFGFYKAIYNFIVKHIYTLFPSLYNFIHKNI